MENEMELSAKEIMVQLKKDIEQKKIELAEAEKASEEAHEKSSKSRRKYNNLSWPSDVAKRSGITAGVAAIIGGGVSNFVRDGGNLKPIDNCREYFLNHPDKFEYAKEVTGSSDLDYICGFVSGNDSAAEALYAASGLKDFFWDNMCAAGVDAALIGAAVFGIPIAGSLILRKYYDRKDRQASKQYEKARSKKMSVRSEYKKLTETLEQMEMEQAKKSETNQKPTEVAVNSLK